jgi:soluble epoxide hydrolase/lipid-phosphate phosphatase
VLTANQVLDYYVKEYTKHGLHPTRTLYPPIDPLPFHRPHHLTQRDLHDHLTNLLNLVNWYRTRRANWEEDQALLDKKTITQPVLFIQATHDSVLKPEMSKNMEQFIPNMTRGEVAASHWALTQAPEEVNKIICQWIEGQGLVGKKGEKSSL